LRAIGHAIIGIEANSFKGNAETEMLEPSEKAKDPQRQKIDLHTCLFLAAIAVYLLTRLIRLTQFPIYFFTDEAIQSVAADDLVSQQFRDASGTLLPTYFENGSQYNLSLSVYWQILPNLLFGQSVFVTRGAAVIGTLLAAVFIGLILRDFFKVKLWWLGTLILAATPAWFLHSRTAFETTLMASMYTAFLYFYLSYRLRKPKHLYAAFVFGALTFYAYSPGQVVMAASGIVLLFSDWRYHWQQRKVVLPGVLLLVLLAMPYLRFKLMFGYEIHHHLQQLRSYWMEEIPLIEKFGKYLVRYLKGLNPVYWFLPNTGDLIRHTMKGMGHLLIIFLPFFMIGLWQCIKHFKRPEYHLVILALLAAPTGAAIVDVAITRVLVLVIPATLVSAIGTAWFLDQTSRFILPLKVTSLVTFALLSGLSFWILGDALLHGATWYDNYGLYGLQYGGITLFDEINTIRQEAPTRKITLSPSWANGTDVIARYFLGTPLPITIGTIEEYAINHLPLKKDDLFIMLPNEYDWMLETGKFTNVEVDKTLPCPDETPCFYFVNLDYVPNIDQILKEEIEQRRQLQETELTLFEQQVKVLYPLLDINEIQQAFDGDPSTLIRTFEANPLRIVLVFTEPVEMVGLEALIGGPRTRVTTRINPERSEEVHEFFVEVDQSNINRTAALDFGKSLLVQSIEIEILNIDDPEIAHVHLWEITFK